MFSVMTRELLSIIEHGLAGFACQQPEIFLPKVEIDPNQV